MIAGVVMIDMPLPLEKVVLVYTQRSVSMWDHDGTVRLMQIGVYVLGPVADCFVGFAGGAAADRNEDDNGVRSNSSPFNAEHD